MGLTKSMSGINPTILGMKSKISTLLKFYHSESVYLKPIFKSMRESEIEKRLTKTTVFNILKLLYLCEKNRTNKLD